MRGSADNPYNDTYVVPERGANAGVLWLRIHTRSTWWAAGGADRGTSKVHSMRKPLLWAGLVLLLCALLGRDTTVWREARAKRDLEGCEKSLKAIGTAIDMYTTDNGGVWPARDPSGGPFTPDLRLLVPHYLKEIPTCPAAGEDTYSKAYYCTRDRAYYTLVCEGRFHEDAHVPRCFPQYSSTCGLWRRPPEGSQGACEPL